MAYDEQLADRIRAILAAQPQVTERRMFGGLAFLVGSHMAVAVSGQGGLMVRVGDEDDTLLDEPHVGPVEMRGRPMAGWVRVDAEGLEGAAALERWVRLGVAFARALPPKTG